MSEDGGDSPRMRLVAIFHELLVNGRRTRAELETLLGVNERQMREDLRVLEKQGLLEANPPTGPNRAYQLRPDLLVHGLPAPDQLAWVVGRQVTRFLAGTQLHAEGGEPSLEQVVRYIP